MLKTKARAVLAALTILNFSAVAVAKDINAVTAEGRSVVLHEDGSWSLLESTVGDRDGKVNLALANLRNISSSCSARLQYENLTDVFFDDFAPGILMMDRDGFIVGEGCGVGMENLRPNGIATCEVWSQNVPCSDIAAIVVSGWQFCEINGRRDASGRICDPFLNVLPSTHKVQLIKR